MEFGPYISRSSESGNSLGISATRESPGVSVVVPVYNSADSLAELAARLEPVLRSLDMPFELILVNDGSRDRSWGVARELAAARPWIRGIDLMRNFGQHNALLCGIRSARFDTLVTLDDDLQHPPEEIPRLLDRLQQGFDVVYGTPRGERHGFLRTLASRVTKLALQSAMGIEAARNVSAFRVFRTRLREAFAGFRSPFVCIDVLLSWGTARFSAVEARHDPRRIGASNYTVGKLMRHAMTMITGFSTWPLQLASQIGFLFTLFGIGVFLYVIVRFLLFGAVVPGFTFLASAIAIFSGAQLLALGIIGEYLARMHFRALDRPAYVIRETEERLFVANAVRTAEPGEALR